MYLRKNRKARNAFDSAARYAVAGMCVFLLAVCVRPLYADESSARKKFTVALTGKYPPFSFYSAGGELTGFDVDVARAVAGRLDRELELVTTEWDGILAGLLVGKYDAIIGSMAVTPQRAEKVNFSEPYYVSGAQLFIHEKNRRTIKGIKDLYGRKVGVGIGETYEHYLRNKHPEIKTLAYKSTVDIFQDMRNGRIAGFVTDRLVGLYQIKKGGMPFQPAGPLLYKERMAIPVVKENPALLVKINRALKNMKKSGELDEFHEKWFGTGTGPQESRDAAMTTKTIVIKLLAGFGKTLQAAFLSIIIGFILAVPSGIVLNSRRTVAYYFVRSVNDFIRGTPLLIQLFFVYFGAPQIGLVLSPMQAAVFTLSINTSAYMAEVIRSGLMAVDPGQTLAGRSLGLTGLQIFRHIVWPQAFRISLPPLMNSVVALMKDTALIAVISVSEVIREAQSIISVTYEPLKYYFIVAMMFFVFTFPLMKLAGRLERKIKEKGFLNA
ncbi:MAG: ABC transporter permease subunit [Candidatus Omnitrophica bacterium]|nr:ABC transporter permease subunit [Candidatus Omnitrophota bacterium]